MRAESSYTYDLFISHASEDKDTFVRPLAQQLDVFWCYLRKKISNCSFLSFY